MHMCLVLLRGQVGVIEGREPGVEGFRREFCACGRESTQLVVPVAANFREIFS